MTRGIRFAGDPQVGGVGETTLAASSPGSNYIKCLRQLLSPKKYPKLVSKGVILPKSAKFGSVSNSGSWQNGLGAPSSQYKNTWSFLRRGKLFVMLTDVSSGDCILRMSDPDVFFGGNVVTVTKTGAGIAAYGVNDRVLLGHSDGKIYESPNVTDTTFSLDSGVASPFIPTQMVYFNNKYIGYTSSDLKSSTGAWATWTSLTIGSITGSLVALIHDEASDRLILISTGRQIWTSADGTTWTLLTGVTGLGAASLANLVADGDGNYIVYAAGAGQYYRSSDLLTWTLETAADLVTVCGSGGTFFFGFDDSGSGTTNRLEYSVDGGDTRSVLASNVFSIPANDHTYGIVSNGNVVVHLVWNYVSNIAKQSVSKQICAAPAPDSSIIAGTTYERYMRVQ